MEAPASTEDTQEHTSGINGETAATAFTAVKGKNSPIALWVHLVDYGYATPSLITSSSDWGPVLTSIAGT